VKAAALVGPPEVAVEKITHSSVPLPYCIPPPTPPYYIGQNLVSIGLAGVVPGKIFHSNGLRLKSSIHWSYRSTRTGKPQAGARGFSVFPPINSIAEVSRGLRVKSMI
jgi:hypothetical protein